uniref:Uncharacterized protein n=1 Tax=Chenopodium quinoa TaxID=63459 RepID=A0A803LF32_CHEQI
MVEDDKLGARSEYKPNLLDGFFLDSFRKKLVEEVGWDSEKAGYDGMMELVNGLMLGRTTQQTNQAADTAAVDSEFPIVNPSFGYGFNEKNHPLLDDADLFKMIHTLDQLVPETEPPLFYPSQTEPLLSIEDINLNNESSPPRYTEGYESPQYETNRSATEYTKGRKEFEKSMEKIENSRKVKGAAKGKKKATTKTSPMQPPSPKSPNTVFKGLPLRRSPRFSPLAVTDTPNASDADPLTNASQTTMFRKKVPRSTTIRKGLVKGSIVTEKRMLGVGDRVSQLQGSVSRVNVNMSEGSSAGDNVGEVQGTSDSRVRRKMTFVVDSSESVETQPNPGFNLGEEDEDSDGDTNESVVIKNPRVRDQSNAAKAAKATKQSEALGSQSAATQPSASQAAASTKKTKGKKGRPSAEQQTVLTASQLPSQPIQMSQGNSQS